MSERPGLMLAGYPTTIQAGDDLITCRGHGAVVFRGKSLLRWTGIRTTEAIKVGVMEAFFQGVICINGTSFSTVGVEWLPTGDVDGRVVARLLAAGAELDFDLDTVVERTQFWKFLPRPRRPRSFASRVRAFLA